MHDDIYQHTCISISTKLMWSQYLLCSWPSVFILQWDSFNSELKMFCLLCTYSTLLVLHWMTEKSDLLHKWNYSKKKIGVHFWGEGRWQWPSGWGLTFKHRSVWGLWVRRLHELYERKQFYKIYSTAGRTVKTKPQLHYHGLTSEVISELGKNISCTSFEWISFVKFY